MCGICGYISTGVTLSEEELLRMNNSLTHRGPDAGEIWKDEVAGLGNRRLKILDLSDAGNQPMTSANGRYVMVYNGEVYNYVELADELYRDHGVTFSSSSDSEVVLEAYCKWGKDSFSRFNGMFSIAIYDKKEKKLCLVRDRSGIKPLYYFYDTSGKFAFASEINAFHQVPSIPKEINRAVIPAFLHLGYIPSPQSIYRNIFKLKPGYWMETDGRDILEGTFSVRECSNKLVLDEKKAASELEELLSDSVRLQLRSDVPSGIFLSGGIDSSLLTALATKVSAISIQTFSIGFKETKFDESGFAQKVADTLKTDHHPFIVSLDDATDLFDKVTEVYGEPFADSSAIPTMMVSQLAKNYVSVALSGEGGDELFYGYGSYNWAKRLSNPLIYMNRHFLGSLLQLTGISRNKRVAELLNFSSGTFVEGHIFSQEQYLFSDKELYEISSQLIGMGPSWFQEYNRELGRSNEKLSRLQKQSLFDLHYYLPDDLLVKVDRASMHYSLETRVPYLDPRVIDFAGQLDENLKMKGTTSKYILKKILYKHLPEKLFHRPKQGFTIPLDNWLKDRWEKYIADYLKQDVIEQYGFVKYEKVKALLAKYKSGGHQYLYNRIWALITLHRWLCKFHP